MNKQFNNYFLKEDFGYVHKTDVSSNIETFEYEVHPLNHELYIFFKGNTEFRVEGTYYPMRYGDVMIVNNEEFHKPYHYPPSTEYERVVISIGKDFFENNDCEELAGIFINHSPGTKNIIPSRITKNTSIFDIIKSIDYYIENFDTVPEYIIKGKIFELLFVLNNINSNTSDDIGTKSSIKHIIEYIEQNLTNKISLNTIANDLFINKSYLCRIFKKETGSTVNSYITRKRFLLVKNLVDSGMSITSASIQAGFDNYSNFYQLYKKETNLSPNKGFTQNTSFNFFHE